MRRLGAVVCVLAWVVAAGAADCNLNGVDDATEIGGGAADCNANGMPDTCELFRVAFAASRLPAGSSPAAIATGELTGDRLLDLAIANRDAGTVTIYEGAPGGTFTSPDTVNVGMRPEAVVAAELSGPIIIGTGSVTDLVVANGDSNSVSVLRNAGDGTFSNITGSPFSVAAHPNGLAVADLNGDGFPDIVVSVRDATPMAGVRALVNDGSGGFTGPFAIAPTGAQPRAVVLADLNADGFPDILVANRGSGTVSFLRNNSGGGLFPAVDVATVADPVAIAVADLDADADLDLAVLSGTDNAVHLFLNAGASTFSPGATVPAAAQGAALQLVDMDGDGAVDIVAITTGGDAAVIALNDGAGVFGASTAIAVGDGPLDVVPLDIDGDGRTDLVVTNSLSADVSVLLGTGPVVRDCDATGVLDACEPARLDCNANGVADTCDALSPVAFGAPVYTPVTDTSSPLAVGDLDGDGRADVVWRRTGPKLVVGRGMPDGRLAELGAFDLPDNPTRLLLADVEGDGDRDVVVTSNAGRTVHVLRNDGAGSLAAPETYALTNRP
ncbi:MAG TPA: VCBS repeat-containing protein, partial [Candidatus Binatus sp.]|nr:VCBS repeat-containing protein [Candidatus Binatus sp.]